MVITGDLGVYVLVFFPRCLVVTIKWFQWFSFGVQSNDQTSFWGLENVAVGEPVVLRGDTVGWGLRSKL